jgi:hypothetical protein
MRKITLCILMLLAALGAAGAAFLDPQGPDEKAFQEVKILIFDQKWDEAASRLDAFLESYPKSPLAAQAVYYKGKCLEERGGREREALESYRAFLQRRDQNRNLVEDAEVSIVDLAAGLYDRGAREAWDDLEVRLTHSNRSVRQYAALRVSALKDLKKAEMAVPILLLMAEKESNSELRDRAKIALLRIAPDRLAGLDNGRPPADRPARLLRIEAVDEGSGRIALSLTLPRALADLALAAIPDEDKRALRAKGYDIQKIMAELESARGKIVEISFEGKRLRIWLD